MQRFINVILYEAYPHLHAEVDRAALAAAKDEAAQKAQSLTQCAHAISSEAPDVCAHCGNDMPFSLLREHSLETPQTDREVACPDDTVLRLIIRKV